MENKQLKRFSNINESNNEIPQIELKPVDADQRTFDFIDSRGEKYTATIHSMHKRITLRYPTGAEDDVPIKHIVDGSAKFDHYPDTEESVRRWIREDVLRISDMQQEVVIHPNGTKMFLYDGILGQYIAECSSEVVSLSLPRITVSGTVADLKLLEGYFNLLENGQLTRFLRSVESKLRKDKERERK